MYNEFSFQKDGYIITCTQKIFSRTESGKSWKSKADAVKTEMVSNEFYTNYITSIPAFNNFGDGWSRRAYWDYTSAGYLPTRVVTVSPYGEVKEVAEFTIERA